ncbi:DUF535 family protein [Helicobacter felis]|uniref:DUF535 family protein n=1 Tax=Helicobacter felis TaxID=214 RepID=UPI001F3DC2A7|nr:DUF535 family protein [Helicobacter felis]
MELGTYLKTFKGGIRHLLVILKSFLKYVVSLGFRIALRLFPSMCRASCLRIWQTLWCFFQRDHDLNIKIRQNMVDEVMAQRDHDLNVRIWLQMVGEVINWLEKNEIPASTFLALIPSICPTNLVKEFETTYLLFGDARLTHAEHIAWIALNLRFLQNLQIYDGSAYRDFLVLQSIEFYTLRDAGGGEYSFCFKTLRENHMCYLEGFLALEISYVRGNTSTRIYGSSLCITPQSHLLITSVQGELGVASEHIRFLSKHCYCYPGFFLVELQKILTRILGLNKTLGTPNAGQVSYVDHGGLARDYDELYVKRGASLLKIEGRSYYDLPHTHKDLSLYPQKKRSVHRKRLKLLEEMEDNLKRKLVRNG